MVIVSKDYGILLNFDNVAELFTGSNKTAIVAKQMDGKLICLKNYETEQEAKKAISIIADEMYRKNIVCIPSKEEVKIKMDAEESRWHHATGKKTKGHGGS